jgi:hypothetical protein
MRLILIDAGATSYGDHLLQTFSACAIKVTIMYSTPESVREAVHTAHREGVEYVAVVAMRHAERGDIVELWADRDPRGYDMTLEDVVNFVHNDARTTGEQIAEYLASTKTAASAAVAPPVPVAPAMQPGALPPGYGPYYAQPGADVAQLMNLFQVVKNMTAQSQPQPQPQPQMAMPMQPQPMQMSGMMMPSASSVSAETQALVNQILRLKNDAAQQQPQQQPSNPASALLNMLQGPKK